jgi:hypothetical protein
MDCAFPVLASLDFDSTVVFYRRLGFEVVERYDTYLILNREALILHFWACDDRRIAEATSCYIRTEDVHGWHQRCQSAGTKPNGIAQTDYGMLEFALWDDSGNLLRFGEVV